MDSTKEQSKSKRVLSIIGAVLFFFIAYFVTQYVTHEAIVEVQVANIPKEEYIQMAVDSIKSEQILPKEVDEVTTWTDITGTSEALQYHYTVHDIDAEAIDIALLKENMIPALCTTAETKRFLDKEITMEYYYSIKDAPQEYTIAVKKADCF